MNFEHLHLKQNVKRMTSLIFKKERDKNEIISMFKLIPYSIKGGFPFSHSLEQLKAHNIMVGISPLKNSKHRLFLFAQTKFYNP